MEVYVLYCDYHVESGESESYIIGVYQKAEDAFNNLKQEIEQAKQDISERSSDLASYDYHEGDMAWSIWQEGCYDINHINLAIKQCEVQ